MISYERSSLSVGVRNIMIVSFVIYVLQMVPVLGDTIFGIGALVPSLAFSKFQIWRFVTYLFLHNPVGPWHLIFNMLALWMFGTEIETLWGTKRFIIFYLICGVSAGLLSFLMWNIPIIGASGAILGLLTVYAYYFPNRTVLMFFIFPIPVRWAVIIIGFISVTGSMTGIGNIAHLTHLGGIIAAIIYIKSYDVVMIWIKNYSSIKQEKKMRQNVEKNLSKKKYFEEVIDPILRKISEEGMNSLTKQEKNLLKHASKTNKEEMKKSKIIPFGL